MKRTAWLGAALVAVAVLALAARGRAVARPGDAAPGDGPTTPAAVPESTSGPGRTERPPSRTLAPEHASELSLIRERVAGIRRGSDDPRVQRVMIEQHCASRAGAFVAAFERDPESIESFYEAVLAERATDLRLALARILRAATARLRDRLLTVEDRDLAIAALGSAPDAACHDMLSLAAHSGSTEETRALALESMASEPSRYDGWQGRELAEAVLRSVLERDASARVRASAAQAYATFTASSPERREYARGLLTREKDDSVREALRELAAEPKRE